MALKDKVKYSLNVILQSVFRYKYRSQRYQGTFLAKVDKATDIKTNRYFEPIIYCFWTENNEMSENRKNCLQSIIERSGVPVQLITPKNLGEYILKEHPLHPAFQYLSAVHKSDYLRCYFMNFYGGGYSDLKMCLNSWTTGFETLRNTDKWILGYRETRRKDLAVVDGNIRVDLRRHFLSVIGNCSYICVPNSPFTQEWYSELISRMDGYAEKLKNNPGNIWGDNEGYPIPWTNILGSIFHPLCLKYSEKIIQSKLIKPGLKNYR